MDTTILVNRSHRLRRNQIPQLLVEPDILFTVPAGDARRLLLAPAANAVESCFPEEKRKISICAAFRDIGVTKDRKNCTGQNVKRIRGKNRSAVGSTSGSQ